MNTRIIYHTKTYAGYLLTAISMYLLISVFHESRKTISYFPLNTLTISIILLTLIVVLIGHSSLVLTWFIQLTKKYPTLRINNAFIAVGLSQIAKYIPGNVAHLLGRTVLINRYVNKEDVALTLLFESLILAFSAAFFGYLWGREFALPIEFPDIYALSTLIFLTFLFIFLIEFLKKKTNVVFLTYSTFTSIFTLFCISFLLHGAAIYLIAVHLVNIHNLTLLQCTYGFALSFIIGYILPGAPGGIGVREYAFVILFIPFIKEIHALQIIVIFRLISIAGDAIIFFLTMIYQKKIATLSESDINENAC